MDLAIARLKANEKVSLLNRFKIFRFLDCLETKQIALPRRIRYLVDLTTFASMLYDFGGRLGEILNLQRKNINFDQQGAVVVVDGKTGQHRERLIVSVPFAAEWMNDHPSKTPTAPERTLGNVRAEQDEAEGVRFSVFLCWVFRIAGLSLPKLSPCPVEVIYRVRQRGPEG